MKRPAPLVIVGDWNLTAEDVEPIAGQLVGELVRGRGVDHAIVRDARPLRVMRLGAFGSDHDAVLYRFNVAGEIVDVLWWNVDVQQHPADVLRAVAGLAGQWSPHVIALGEAYRCRRVLSDVAGYRHVQGRRGEARGIAVLVRGRLDIVRSGWLLMTAPWIGPQLGRRKTPRRYARLRLRLRTGAEFRFLAVHLPTGGWRGRNRLAVRESVERILDWGGPVNR